MLYYDSQSATHLSKNLTFHLRLKYVEVWYHWTWEALEMKQVNIKKIYSNNKFLRYNDEGLAN